MKLPRTLSRRLQCVQHWWGTSIWFHGIKADIISPLGILDNRYYIRIVDQVVQFVLERISLRCEDTEGRLVDEGVEGNGIDHGFNWCFRNLFNCFEILYTLWFTMAHLERTSTRIVHSMRITYTQCFPINFTQLPTIEFAKGSAYLPVSLC